MSTASREFSGVSRALGESVAEQLQSAHVIVVGVGGVGSWAVEGLARSGIGKITMIDMDHVAASNVNRQVHAMQSTIGALKIRVMADRIADINPQCAVEQIDDFVTVGNVEQLLSSAANLIIDATDQASVKAAMIVLCRRRKQPLIVCGAAGARTNPLTLKQADLARTTGDALLARVRKILRREYGFSRNTKRPIRVQAIYSTEQAQGLLPDDSTMRNTDDLPSAQLACSGYGSLVTVTAAMGFSAAAATISVLGKSAASVHNAASED